MQPVTCPPGRIADAGASSFARLAERNVTPGGRYLIHGSRQKETIRQAQAA
jgi:hypothetical protein